MSKYEMTIDLNVLNHLGINLYSNISAVLSEAVANAWDADAESVLIQADTSDPDAACITIEDDGEGMNLSDINKKFLKVGYEKRRDLVKTLEKGRPVMGRKGIGKLSLFSIANVIEIHSFKDGEKNGFVLDLKKIHEQIEADGHAKYEPDEVDLSEIKLTKPGTVIKLTHLHKRFRALDQKLKMRISRRFSILSEDFTVKVNGDTVSIQDRDYFRSLQYMWHLSDEGDRYYNDESLSFDKESTLDGGLEYLYTPKDLFEASAPERTESVSLSGWIGSVKESGQLKDGLDNLNKISLIVRGKVAKEDILSYVNEDRIFTKYLIGEIHADFLDDDDKDDIATSSRQDFSENDPRFEALIAKVTDLIKKEVGRDWDKWRREKATDKALKNPALEGWYGSLSKENKTEAKKLFARIGSLGVTGEKEKELIKQGVLGFERLRMTQSLSELDGVLDALDPRFEQIFNTIDDLEAVLYHDIAKGRVHVIEQLDRKVTENELETLIQKFLFDHLWLLDPSWDRATEAPAYMEKSLKKMFGDVDASLSPDEAAGRIDLEYRTSAGRHIIVELKRPKVKTNVYDLLKQTGKYASGLKKMLVAQGEANPAIESVCVVGRPLDGWEDSSVRLKDEQVAKEDGVKIMLYDEIISNSAKSYNDFLEKDKEVSRIRDLLDTL